MTPLQTRIVAALEAEGIPCSAGYGFSLPAQPIFREKAFGPYLAGVRETLDYGKVRCANSDRVCRESIWLEQNLFLGTRGDTDYIGDAFEKVYEEREDLMASAVRETKD